MPRAWPAVLVLPLAACATQPPHGAGPGFFMGLLHGFLTPFSLAGSLFLDVRIYAFPNAGFGYDLGFLSGIGLLISAIVVAAMPWVGGFITRRN